jgi:hypothetical protein
VSLEADIPLNEWAGIRLIDVGCSIPGLPEMLLDRVTHDVRLESGFALGLDPEPAFLARGVTDELHAL